MTTFMKSSAGPGDFVASVLLFGFARSEGHESLARRWTFIGARNGALALRNYVEALSALRATVGRVKSWDGKVDTSALKAVETDFRAKFPRVEKLRHAVAHPEFYANPNVNMKLDGDDIVQRVHIGGSKIQDMLVNFTFACTINGLLVKYDATLESAAAINELTIRAFGAFDGVSEA